MEKYLSYFMCIPLSTLDIFNVNSLQYDDSRRCYTYNITVNIDIDFYELSFFLHINNYSRLNSQTDASASGLHVFNAN